MEVILACGSVALFCLALWATYAMLKKGEGGGGAGSDDVEGKASVFMAEDWSFPCKCCLTQHAYLSHGRSFQ